MIEERLNALQKAIEAIESLTLQFIDDRCDKSKAAASYFYRLGRNTDIALTEVKAVQNLLFKASKKC